jgi:hypothetical protein
MIPHAPTMDGILNIVVIIHWKHWKREGGCPARLLQWSTAGACGFPGQPSSIPLLCLERA